MSSLKTQLLITIKRVKCFKFKSKAITDGWMTQIPKRKYNHIFLSTG